MLIFYNFVLEYFSFPFQSTFQIKANYSNYFEKRIINGIKKKGKEKLVYDRKIFYEREFVKGKKSGNDKYYWIKINIIGKN